MAILNQEKSELLQELKTLRIELNEVKSKYELILESTGSHFIIFQNNSIIEFSPKSEELFVFASDFSDKLMEELMPIFQVNGQPSKDVWYNKIQAAQKSQSKPFEFEFLDKAGNTFLANTLVKLIDKNKYIANLELLEESENLRNTIQSMADNAPVLIRMTNQKNQFNYFSKKWVDFTGRNKSKEADEGWLSHVHKDEVKEIKTLLSAAFAKRIKYEISFRLKDQNGDYKWLLDTGVPRLSVNGEFIGYISAAIDITERKNIELESTQQKALIESEKKIQNSLDKSEIMALTTDTDGIITFTNKEFLRTIGLFKSDVTGRNLFEFFYPDSNIDQEKFRKAAMSGHFSDMLSGNFSSSKGKDVILRFNAVILKNAKGQVSGITLFGENITERRKILSQLEQTNNQLEELFDNSNDLIQIFDEKWKFQFVNEAWKQKLGFSDEELLKQSLKSIVNPKYWEATQSTLKKISEGEIIERFETVFISKNDKNIFVSGRVNCTVDKKSIQFRGIFYDITERIRAEKAQSLYYKIASSSIEGQDLELLYDSIFKELNNILKVDNFSVSLKSPKKGNKITFPYFINENTNPKELKEQKDITELLSNYTFERKKPLIIYQEGIKKIGQLKKQALPILLPKIWLGVQINIANQPIGVISIHSYKDSTAFNHKDLDLLYFISSQVSNSVERTINLDKIKDQSAKLEAIFESSSHQIWSIDKNFNLSSYNNNYADALLDYYNITASIGPGFQDEKEKFPKAINAFWIKNYEKAFKGETLNFQHKLKLSKDQYVYRDVFINPIVQADRSIEEVSVIANDITEKYSADKALAESEEKFRDIFESFQDIYFRCDMKGEIIMVSPSIEEVVKHTSQNIIGKNILSYFQADSKIETILNDLFEYKSVKNFEGRLKNKFNKEIRFLGNIRLVEKNNQAIAIEGVARDITELKNANEELKGAKNLAEKSLEIKERFLANMSHEIRTPMNGIIGMIDLIGSTKLNKEQFGYVKTIKKSSDNLLEILNDILDLSKIEAGKMELRKKPVYIVSTFEKLYEIYSQQAFSQNIGLYYHLGKDLPEVLMIDEVRLLQVLSNLTSNAIKFSSSKGTVNISLRMIEKKRKICKFKVQIKDEGIGIKKEEIDNLFINFNQLDNSVSKNYSGTGLGLAISKELVKSMKGEIGVASTPGLGSTFWFTFYAEIPKSLPEVLPEESESTKITKQFIGTKPAILVVDDNKVNRTVAGQILSKSGCIVDLAEGGFEAIAKVKERTYDIIFMDIQMPIIDGVKATNEIKSLGIKNLPPIIAMTAYSMEEDREKFLRQGLDDYVAKPIKAITLINKVKEYTTFRPKEVEISVFDEAPEKLIINQNTLNQLFKYGGQELVNSILEEFEIEAKQLIKNSLHHYDNNDIEEVRKELHTLKGSSGTLGIEKLEGLTISLERQLKNEDLTELKEQLIAIEASFKEFKNNYKNILKN
jgi:PAS domain S-box-containing protein